jgi:hypothetical protein
MDRQQLLKRLDQAWAELRESYAGLSDAQIMEPGVQGRWSVRDILAHVTTWEEEALTHLPLIIEGGRPPRYSTRYGGIDAFNALMTEQKRGLSLSEVLRQLDEVHDRLIDYVHGAPEELLTGETRFRRRLRLDAYGHYPKHARAIRTWRVLLVLAALAVPTAAVAQQAPMQYDSVRAGIHTTLRAFYFNLAHRDWEALTADILAAKVVAHRPAPDALVAAAALPSSAEAPPPCPETTPPVERAAITLEGEWAEASVPRCAGTDEFRLIHFEQRWRIVHIDLFQEPMSVSADR